MTTTWYLIALIATGALCLAILFHRPLLDRLMGLSPTQPGDPDEVESGDRPDSGADPEFARELRAMKAATIRDDIGQELLANLRTSALEEVAAHEKVAQTIDALCDDLMAELDAICDKYNAAAKALGRRHTKELDLDAHGRAWLAAGLPGDTGSFDRRELEAMLAGAT